MQVPVSFASALLFAAQWLVAWVAGTIICWGIVRYFLRRRLGGQAFHHHPLFAAVGLVCFAAANLYIESRAFSMRLPLLAAPAGVLFLLLFYVYPDRRFAGRGIRWLAIVCAFALISSYVPSRQSLNPTAATLAAIPGLAGVGTIFGNTAALAPTVLGVLPQLYGRSRRLALLGIEDGPYPRNWLGLGAAAIACGYALMLAAGLLTMGPPGPVLSLARILFFLLTSLIPVGVAYALLSGRRYDRAALLRRAVTNIALVGSLLVVYAAGVVAFALAFPGFSGPGYAYLPFILPMGALLAAIYPSLRSEIEAQVGRRLFPQTYASERALLAAAASLAAEPRLGPLADRLAGAVATGLHPASVGIWLRPLGRSSTPGGALALRWQTGVPASAPPGAAALTLDDERAPLLRPVPAIDAEILPIDSHVAAALRAAGAKLVVPLLDAGELVGVLALGPLPATRGYGEDERAALGALAATAAPALRAAQTASVQEAEARERERMEQELQTARRIQESLLPKTLPELPAWRIATHYQPAREVGGDFYDFLSLPDGRLGILLGDVTDKGIPAALVMATTRSMLRAVAVQPGVTPGTVLAQVNDLLCLDLPTTMFVTCFYAVLDPSSGALHFANAGQDLPYRRRSDGSVGELRARGLPLGLMPEARYDEEEAALAPGDSLLFYSDGLVEAHNAAREMFGEPRLARLLGAPSADPPTIDALLHELAAFTGDGWEQEDDITLVTLRYECIPDVPTPNGAPGAAGRREG